MKNKSHIGKLAACICCAAGASAAFAAPAPLSCVPCPPVVTTNVEGDVSATSPLGVYRGQTLRKTGSGTLTLNTSALEVPTAVEVTNGTLRLVREEAVPALPALSQTIQDKMLVWLSAKDTAHLVTKNLEGDETDYIETWYDVRETDMTAPKYCYGVANHEVTTKGPWIREGKIIDQYDTRTNSMTAAYFGGLLSGISLDFKRPNGTDLAHCPYEVAVVNGVVDTWGYLIGTSMNTTELTPYEPEASRHNSNPNGNDSVPFYGWGEAWGPLLGDAANWLDGEKIDMLTLVRPGFHVLHRRINTLAGDYGAKPKATQWDAFKLAIFSYRSAEGDTATKGKKGGDYVGEFICFSNVLTHTERQQVDAYLAQKWFGRKVPHAAVSLASGATLEVVADDDAELDFAVKGDGSFVKKGDGSLLYRPSADNAATPAETTLEGGTLFATRTLAVKCNAGDAVTATALGNAISTAAVTRVKSSNSDEFAKKGGGTLTVSGVQDDVGRLRVEAGSLVLRPRMAAPRKYEIEIPNAGFENWNSVGAGTKPTCYIPTSATAYGWVRSGDAHACNHEKWTASTAAGDNYGSMSAKNTAYGFADDPPEGNCYLVTIGKSAYIWNTVTIPEPGEYELTFCMSGRRSYTHTATADLALYDSTGATLAVDFGHVNYVQGDRWVQYALRATVTTPGTYRLRAGTNWTDPIGELSQITFRWDDFHLYRIGDARTEWKIPGGDFERLNNLTLFNGRMANPVDLNESMTNGVDGWTFDGTLFNGYKSAWIVNSRMIAQSGRYYGDAYNGSMRPLGGEYQLLFRHPGSSVTAKFTPPAGTWYLKGWAGYWSVYGKAKLSAKIGATNLGDYVLPRRRTMKPHVWETPFVSDGSTEVTLTLTYTDYEATSGYPRGISVDDFTLVGAYENSEELLKNGDFELPFQTNKVNVEISDWQSIHGSCFTNNIPDPTKYGQNNAREYGRNDHDAFGTDHGSGNFFTEPYDYGGLGQDVTLPHDGCYRFTGLFKSRISSTTFKYLAIELVDLANPSVTNRIGHVSNASRAVFEERSFLFKAKAGAYRLILHNVVSGYYCMDDLSLRYVGPSEGVVEMPENLVVSVSPGASIQLDSPATNVVRRFIAGGKVYRGVVTAKECPEIDGPGAFKVKENGLTIIAR